MQHEEQFDTPFETIDLALLETVDGGRRLPSWKDVKKGWEAVKSGASTAWEYTKKVGGWIGTGALVYEIGKAGAEAGKGVVDWWRGKKEAPIEE